ncbi:molybdopterin dinucleotide binding domain-containing protein, partial [Escherichia coli]|nr:molybdopterin dinucleotide binding domain-containing protein [Escherichia coli]
RKRAYCLKIQPATGSFARNLIYSTKPHRGEVRLPAKVTPRILPGVSAMGQGAWHEANMSGDKIDHGGCVNTLTTLRPSPLAKGNPQHTNLVEIEKI